MGKWKMSTIIGENAREGFWKTRVTGTLFMRLKSVPSIVSRINQQRLSRTMLETKKTLDVKTYSPIMKICSKEVNGLSRETKYQNMCLSIKKQLKNVYKKLLLEISSVSD